MTLFLKASLFVMLKIIEDYLTIPHLASPKLGEGSLGAREVFDLVMYFFWHAIASSTHSFGS